MLGDEPGQSPAQPGPADFLSWRYCLAQVFTPYALAVATAVAAVPDDQDGGPPAAGLVGESASDGIAGNCGATADAAPRVRGGDVAENLGFRRAEVLPDGGQAQLVQACECREVWCGEGRIEQRRGLSKKVV